MRTGHGGKRCVAAGMSGSGGLISPDLTRSGNQVGVGCSGEAMSRKNDEMKYVITVGDNDTVENAMGEMKMLRC